MTINETMTMIALMLAPAFFSLLGMAALGSPVVAVLGEMAAKTKGKVFYDKYGQQTATMGCVLLILLLVVECAALGIITVKFPQLIERFVTADSPLLCSLAALGLFVILGLPYFLTWKKMRNYKGIHMALGIGASIAALAMVATAVPAKLVVGLSQQTTQAQAAIEVQPMALPMAIMYTILIIAAAAGLSCAYLVLRRNKDDFGRDYYNFSLKLAARWATIPMIGFIGCQAWLFVVLPDNFKTMVMETPLGLVWGAGTGLALICTILWLLIARSQTPLQMKGMTFLAATCMWLMHTMNATLFMNFMSMF